MFASVTCSVHNKVWTSSIRKNHLYHQCSQQVTITITLRTTSWISPPTLSLHLFNPFISRFDLATSKGRHVNDFFGSGKVWTHDLQFDTPRRWPLGQSRSSRRRTAGFVFCQVDHGVNLILTRFTLYIIHLSEAIYFDEAVLSSKDYVKSCLKPVARSENIKIRFTIFSVCRSIEKSTKIITNQQKAHYCDAAFITDFSFLRIR